MTTDKHPFRDRPFTAAMAGQQGVSRNQLQKMLASGLLRKILYDVYVGAGVADSIELRAAAAMLVLPPHAVVTDRCAARLHGVDVLDFAEIDAVPLLEAVSVDGRNPSVRKGILGGKRDLSPDDIMQLPSGIQVTTPLRTACDVACLHGRYRAMATLDEFRRKHQLSQADLATMLPRFRGRRGVIQLRELIPLSTDRADSQPESWIRLMIHDHGLPIPAPQVDVLVPGWGPVRIENAYEHLRIGVEHDGVENHTTIEDRAHDDGRRGALDEDGWAILVLRKGDYTAQRRMEWLTELTRLVAERTPDQPRKRRYSRGPDHPSYRWRRKR